MNAKVDFRTHSDVIDVTSIGCSKKKEHGMLRVRYTSKIPRRNRKFACSGLAKKNLSISCLDSTPPQHGRLDT